MGAKGGVTAATDVVAEPMRGAAETVTAITEVEVVVVAAAGAGAGAGDPESHADCWRSTLPCLLSEEVGGWDPVTGVEQFIRNPLHQPFVHPGGSSCRAL